MGADASKSGGYVPPDSTDHLIARRMPPLSASTRSHSVPTGGLGDEDRGSFYGGDNGSLPKEPLQRPRSTLVVVNRGSTSDTSTTATGSGSGSGGINQDPLMKRLEELHFFYPLMHDVEKRSGLFGTHNRRALADIQSKLDSLPALKIIRIYEDRLRKHAESTSLKQGELSSAIKEADLAISHLLKSYSERAKQTAKCVDRVNKLDDIKRNLTRVQGTFTELCLAVDLLNDMLPENERLEKFNPWAEADEEGAECKET